MLETGLFEIQAEHLRDYRQARQLLPDSRDDIHAMFGRPDTTGQDPQALLSNRINNIETAPVFGMKSDCPAIKFAQCFLRLANLPNFALDRLSQYEATVAAGRPDPICASRKPHERARRFVFAASNHFHLAAANDCNFGAKKSSGRLTSRWHLEPHARWRLGPTWWKNLLWLSCFAVLVAGSIFLLR
jgi:hypothetical protein